MEKMCHVFVGIPHGALSHFSHIVVCPVSIVQLMYFIKQSKGKYFSSPPS